VLINVKGKSRQTNRNFDLDSVFSKQIIAQTNFCSFYNQNGNHYNKQDKQRHAYLAVNDKIRSKHNHPQHIEKVILRSYPMIEPA
jgi:hypothetical protein